MLANQLQGIAFESHRHVGSMREMLLRDYYLYPLAVSQGLSL